MLTILLLAGTIVAPEPLCTAGSLKFAKPGRYSYETCTNAVKLWCRHQKLPDGRLLDQVECTAMNARQCADCVTVRHLRRARGESDEMGDCRQWLDGTIVRKLRDMRRQFSTE